ncbi:MAG: response regulator, partial [Candidatus Sulfotelmatobacter sp.]
MPDLSKHRLMVVDDDSTSRQSITAFLHANGYEITSATDGYDALWQLKNGMVDVMISYLEMPGLSGAEFLSVIRQQYPKMLLIAMTVKPEDQSELATAMADAFFPKGQQHPKKLLSTIAELLRDSAVRRTG